MFKIIFEIFIISLIFIYNITDTRKILDEVQIYVSIFNVIVIEIVENILVIHISLLPTNSNIHVLFVQTMNAVFSSRNIYSVNITLYHY